MREGRRQISEVRGQVNRHHAEGVRFDSRGQRPRIIAVKNLDRAPARAFWLAVMTRGRASVFSSFSSKQIRTGIEPARENQNTFHTQGVALGY